jgi:membrane protease YdiL (CAAX protease family)
MRQIPSSVTPVAKIFILLISLIIGTIIASVLIFSVINIAEWDGLWTFYVSMLIQGICVFVLPAYFAVAITNSQPMAYLGLKDRQKIGEKLRFGLLAFVGAYFFVLFLMHWNKGIELPEAMHGIEQWMRAKEEAAAATTQRFLSVQTIGGLLMNILIVGVVASVAEEIIFRGALQQFLQEWTRNGHVAVWISAFIFSAVHLQFFGFFPRLVLGALLGYLFLYTRNLWIPIFVHFINNAFVLIVSYIGRDSEWLKDIEEIRITPTLIALATVSLVFTVMVFRSYKNRFIDNK